ncbi:MAG TPA: pyrrolo-quinoline quinone [Terriglobia bacterium]|nr:pyrrolo-quinoline quinone [Terriglobia bacterium]
MKTQRASWSARSTGRAEQWDTPQGPAVSAGRWQRVRRLMLACLLLVSAGELPRPAQAQVATSQYDNSRTGSNQRETVLTPRNVNANQFGKLFSMPVDGSIYAQPLYVPRIEIPGKGVHNIVFVATEHDSVYAFDADGNSREALWQVSFINPQKGVTTIPARDVDCPFIEPEIGITSTPVIDVRSGTLYVLARTREKEGAFSNRYVQRLHALAVTTGAEKFGGPVEIKSSARGSGAGSSNGQIEFEPLRENPRAALLLVSDRVYLTWASSCDVGPYHGWVMAYDAHTLAQVAALNTSPDADDSGIWAGDTGPAADPEGNLFLATGNGKFDVVTGGRDYGDSMLKLSLAGNQLLVRDYFTPFNQQELDAEDKDLGSGGPLLLPDQPGPHPHLLVVTGKGGLIYVLDRDQLGGYHSRSDSQIVQTLPGGPDENFGAAAYWNGHVYFIFTGEVPKDFTLSRGRLSVEPARGSRRFLDPGATPTVSSNGSKDGIVWALTSKRWNQPDGPAAVLYAFDASNIARELYSSEMNASRDRAGIGLRFNIPTVVNGRVYVGAKGELDVYGLLSPAAKTGGRN